MIRKSRAINGSSPPENLKRLRTVAAIFSPLSEPVRLQLLECLKGGSASVTELTVRTGLGQANVSKHLQILYREGLLSRTKKGTQAIYAISSPLVAQLCDLVCSRLDDASYY